DRLDHVQQDVALVGARGDVEKAELVRAFAVIARGDLDRIARVTQVDEVDALHHPAGGHVQARNHPLGEPHAQALPTALSAAACALLSSSFPSYNARPAIAPITPSGTSFAHTACTSSTLFSPPAAIISRITFSFFGLPATAPFKSTICRRRAPREAQCFAICTGLSENTVAVSILPCCRRTQRPSFRSIAGMMSTSVLVLNQGRQRTKLERSCRPADWLFSGWNWTAKILSRATAQVKGTP